jgi:small neutral amino acid transporter SnatA (MarC family)
MGWYQFVGTTLLLYGLINPVGAVPIYSRLVRVGALCKSAGAS